VQFYFAPENNISHGPEFDRDTSNAGQRPADLGRHESAALTLAPV
jgi:hypothetical protein